MIMIMGSSSRIGSSFSSCLVAPLPSPFNRTTLFQNEDLPVSIGLRLDRVSLLNFRSSVELGRKWKICNLMVAIHLSRLSQGLFVNKQTAAQLQIYAKDKSCQFKFIYGIPKLKGRFQKQHNALSVVSEDQPQSTELDEAALVPESEDAIAEDISTIGNSSFNYWEVMENQALYHSITVHMEKTRRHYRQNQKRVKIASCDFLILFFTEAIFYCGVAVYLYLLDRLRRPMQQETATTSRDTLPSQLGHRVSSVATLVLSLVIPMVTMGLVWPWTGPAASATLAPYLVGIVVQFAFEQYARYRKSPSWSAIPLIFQVYRLHQLNRAAQLVTALSFTVRGAEMTSHNMAINNSLGTLLNVLQFLGVICIWSLSSFLMRFIPPASTAAQ
ncbi:hypothetical protein Ahy_B10g100425 isoform B [Arachis hypogaea]|uniref:Uncharacterized protein n=1 Tax=Arachis hypogaea TaxID=3818 RepID=A0A444WWH9_ARAHY|nr:hypothetical protein Ahy_B10g100425 isoform B [Arachis hypogaea]